MGGRSGLTRRGVLGAGAVVAGTAAGTGLGAAAYGDPEVQPGSAPRPLSTVGGTLPRDLILHNGTIRTFDNYDRTVSAVAVWRAFRATASTSRR